MQKTVDRSHNAINVPVSRKVDVADLIHGLVGLGGYWQKLNVYRLRDAVRRNGSPVCIDGVLRFDQGVLAPRKQLVWTGGLPWRYWQWIAGRRCSDLDEVLLVGFRNCVELNARIELTEEEKQRIVVECDVTALGRAVLPCDDTEDGELPVQW